MRIKQFFGLLILIIISFRTIGATTDSLLIKNVNIITMEEETILHDHHILIVDGIITQISSKPMGEKYSKVINGKGKFMIPGLFDMHVHLERLEEINLKTFLRYGITGVRNMDGKPKVLRFKENLKKGILLSPDIYSAGTILEGKKPFWDDTEIVKNRKEGLEMVHSQVEAGYDFIKVYHTLSDNAYKGILEAAGKLNIKVAGHINTETGLLKSLKLGHSSVEHLDGYMEYLEAPDSPYLKQWSWKKLYFAFPMDKSKINNAIEATLAAKAINVPTLVVHNQLAPLDKIRARYNDPEISLLPKAIQKQWDPVNFKFIDKLSDSDYRELKLGRQNKYLLIKALHDAGSPIVAGTDTPNPYVLPGKSLHEELILLKKAGLSNYDVLKTATVNAAAWLDLHDHGTVKEGKTANLVLLEGNPLQDVSYTQHIHMVILKGQVISNLKIKDPGASSRGMK